MFSWNEGDLRGDRRTTGTTGDDQDQARRALQQHAGLAEADAKAWERSLGRSVDDGLTNPGIAGIWSRKSCSKKTTPIHCRVHQCLFLQPC